MESYDRDEYPVETTRLLAENINEEGRGGGVDEPDRGSFVSFILVIFRVFSPRPVVNLVQAYRFVLYIGGRGKASILLYLQLLHSKVHQSLEVWKD